MSEVGYKKPPVAHQFKPGQSGNAAGRGKDLIRVDDVQRLIGRLLKLEAAEVAEKAISPTTPAGEAMFASVITKAIKQGDSQAANFILDRSVGKVKDSLEVTTNHDAALELEPRENIVALLRAMRGPVLQIEDK